MKIPVDEREVESAEGLTIAPYFIPRQGGWGIRNDAGEVAAIVHLNRDQTSILVARVEGRADTRSEAGIKRAIELCAGTAHRLAREAGAPRPVRSPTMNETTVCIVNESPLRNGAFKRLAAALAFQIERDFNTSPWVAQGYAPKARVITGVPPAGAWTLSIVPHGNGELGEGWHEQAEDGSIKGFVNYGETHALGGLLSAVASHELLEMLVDPSGTATATDPDTGDRYKLEICDPVYGETYELMGEMVADFCEPAWYGLQDDLPFEWLTHQQTVTAPHTLGQRGYIEVERAGSGVWTQITAA